MFTPPTLPNQSRVIPGFLGTPAGMTTTSAPSSCDAKQPNDAKQPFLSGIRGEERAMLCLRKYPSSRVRAIRSRISQSAKRVRVRSDGRTQAIRSFSGMIANGVAWTTPPALLASEKDCASSISLALVPPFTTGNICLKSPDMTMSRPPKILSLFCRSCSVRLTA